MGEPVVIDGLDGFRALEGRTLGPSRAVEVTQDIIAQFCGAVENDEWIHWDEERCRASSFGTTIAPGMLTPSYFPRLWFELVEIRNIKSMLMLGSDRIRLLAPLKRGARFQMSVTIARVEEREKGIAVHLDATFHVVGEEKPASIANFIIRYID